MALLWALCKVELSGGCICGATSDIMQFQKCSPLGRGFFKCCRRKWQRIQLVNDINSALHSDWYRNHPVFFIVIVQWKSLHKRYCWFQGCRSTRTTSYTHYHVVYKVYKRISRVRNQGTECAILWGNLPGFARVVHSLCWDFDDCFYWEQRLAHEYTDWFTLPAYNELSKMVTF